MMGAVRRNALSASSIINANLESFVKRGAASRKDVRNV